MNNKMMAMAKPVDYILGPKEVRGEVTSGARGFSVACLW